jgi:hypothetical protein
MSFGGASGGGLFYRIGVSESARGLAQSKTLARRNSGLFGSVATGLVGDVRLLMSAAARITGWEGLFYWEVVGCEWIAYKRDKFHPGNRSY